MNTYEWLRGKRILVTGHTGFVGAWMCAVLSFFECDITGFSLPEEDGSIYRKIKKSIRIKNVYGDLRDKNVVKKLIMEANPDIVFHIAAFGFVKECFEDSDRAFYTNVLGTVNLFEAIREMDKPCRIVVASSDKVYRNNGANAYLFEETDPLGGMDPYSSSKTCEDIVAQSFFDSYLDSKGCSLCIVRPSNILGGGDHNLNRLIPSIYCNLKNGRTPEIRNPYAVRPWQNIFDIVDAYLTVASKIESGSVIYNVGPEKEGIKTVGEIAEYVAGLYNVPVEVKMAIESDLEAKEKAYLGLSIDKIKNELKWRPRRTLEQTLDEIYYFYQNDDGSNTFDLCLEQINNYYNEEDNNGKME